MFVATYATEKKLSRNEWACQAFNCKLSELRRRKLCDESGKKFIGNLRLLNKILLDDEVLWLNEVYKLQVYRADYDNFTFEIWHLKSTKPASKGLALLESLLTNAREAKLLKKSKERKEEKTVWNKMVLSSGDVSFYLNEGFKCRQLRDLSLKYLRIETTGMYFYLSRKSIDYDFYVKVTFKETSRVRNWGIPEYSSHLQIKYKSDEPKLKMMEKQCDNLDYIIKLMEESTVKFPSQKKSLNRYKKNKELIEYAAQF